MYIIIDNIEIDTEWFVLAKQGYSKNKRLEDKSERSGISISGHVP